MKKASKYGKALWAFAGTVVLGLMAVVGATPDQRVQSVTQMGWFGFAALVLGVPAGVYAVPNRPQPFTPSAVPSPGNPPIP